MVQLPIFQPKSDWTAPDLSRLPSWEGARRVAVDIETRDPSISQKLGMGVRRGGYITGVSFAIERQNDTPDTLAGAPSYYLPIAHQGGGNLDREHVLSYLRDQAATFRGDIVGANLQYDLDYLAEVGVEFQPRFFRDVQVADPLLYELHFKYNLTAVALRHGFEGKDETLLEQAAVAFGIDKKADMWKLPAWHVGPYAEEDARLPLRLINVLERKIQAKDDEDTTPLNPNTLWELYNLESRVLPVLVKMRRRGVRIDHDQLDRMEARCQREAEIAIQEMARITGHNITIADINRPKVLGPALESVIGTMQKTSQGQVELNKGTFKKYHHPALDALSEARKYHKVANDFVSSIRKHAIGDRIHTSFHQLKRDKDDGSGEAGTVSGRLSSGDPNLQQQPARDPKVGPEWRAIYLPEEGGEWCCIDFSQQEPRWLVHFAELTRCTNAAEAAERYRNDPSTDNHDMMTIMIHGQEAWDSWDKKLKKQHRGDAKTIYLGLCYGMGGGKLARSLGLSTIWKTHTRSGNKYEAAGPEAQAILDTFDARVPFIKQLYWKAQDSAKDKGYVKTVLGRRCHFPLKKDGSGQYDFLHAALNRLIQGSSADQTKKAMVMADEAGIPIQLQVHDELDLTIEHRDQAEHLAEIMRTAVPCNVPHKCDIETGPNWGQIS